MVLSVCSIVDEAEENIDESVEDGVDDVHDADGDSREEVVDDHDEGVDAVDVDVEETGGELRVVVQRERVEEGEVDDGHLQEEEVAVEARGK